MKFYKRRPQRFSHVGDVLLSHAVVFSPSVKLCVQHLDVFLQHHILFSLLLRHGSAHGYASSTVILLSILQYKQIFHECAVSL